MNAPESKPPLPAIPILLFAAIDLVVAFFLLVDGGLTLHFALVAAIGLGLAGTGLYAVFHRNTAE
ncbi:MAG: hypothetical protein M3R12_05670 [Actinomycetota bacterium]|nr:hypothetical protein [Actinomycetota bacterium]